MRVLFVLQKLTCCVQTKTVWTQTKTTRCLMQAKPSLLLSRGILRLVDDLKVLESLALDVMGCVVDDTLLVGTCLDKDGLLLPFST